MIIRYMFNRRKEDGLYQKSCKISLKQGLLCVLPILAVAAVFAIINRILELTVLKNANELISVAMKDFIVAVFAEEVVKFSVLKGVLKRKINAYTWADVVAFMVIIGTGFGLVEDIPYAIGASPAEMLIRGFTLGHVGYAFIMGWFYGKRLYTGKKGYTAAAFLIPFSLHGLYDFSLSPEFLKLNDNLAAIPLSLAVVDIVLLVLIFRFFKRSKNRERYNTPLIPAEESGNPEQITL